jgi:hypothetical protein
MLRQRSYGQKILASLCPTPVLSELAAVLCGPGPHEAERAPRQSTVEDTQVVDRQLSPHLAVLGMEMRRSMIRAVHPNDDAVELAEPRHGRACYRNTVVMRWHIAAAEREGFGSSAATHAGSILLSRKVMRYCASRRGVLQKRQNAPSRSDFAPRKTAAARRGTAAVPSRRPCRPWVRGSALNRAGSLFYPCSAVRRWDTAAG